MKKFTKYLLTVLGTAVAVSMAITLVAMLWLRHSAEFNIPESKNVLVVGGSMGQYGIDAGVLENWYNMSQNAEYFIHTYPMIKKVIESNPQIDTVIINISYASLYSFDDETFSKRRIQSIRLFADRISMADGETLRDNMRMRNFVPFMLTSGVHALLMPPYKGGGGKIYHNALNGDMARRRQEADKQGGLIKTDDIISHNHIQLKYLGKIIDYLESKSIAMVLLVTPQFEIESYYDGTGYYKYLGTLPADLQIADYAELQMPDSSYYSDVIHLHAKGAQLFSTYLKEHGMEMEPIRQYAARKLGK